MTELELSEVAQQEAERVHGRVVKAIEYIQSAYTAASRLRELGGPNFCPTISELLGVADRAEVLVGQAVGERMTHRGLRTPPVCCNDPECPVHGESGSRARPHITLMCSVAAKNRAEQS